MRSTTNISSIVLVNRAGLYTTPIASIFKDPHPENRKAAIYKTEGKSLPDDCILFSVNGVGNTLEYARGSAEMLSEYCGGYQVTYLYNRY